MGGMRHTCLLLSFAKAILGHVVQKMHLSLDDRVGRSVGRSRSGVEYISGLEAFFKRLLRVRDVGYHGMVEEAAVRT